MKTLIAALLLAAPVLAQEVDKLDKPGKAQMKAQRKAQKIVAAKDRDGDGKLTADELGVEAYLFRVLDRNGDGFVTADELIVRRKPAAKQDKPGKPGDRRPPQGRGQGPGQGPGQGGGDFAARLLERHDANGDGKLSKEEFPQGGRLNFEAADANHDGFIDRSELNQLFGGARRGPPGGAPGAKPDPKPGDRPALDPKKVREIAARIMQRLDRNGDGKLTADEIPPRPGKGGKGGPDGRGPDGKGGPDGMGPDGRGPKGGPGRGPGVPVDFAKADKNGDGAIDMLELSLAITEAHARRGMQGPNRGQNFKRMLKLIERMDTNQDGRIDKAEWKGRPETFANLDANQDGAITKDELESVAKRVAGWRSRSGEALFRRMDANEDGKIERDEWKLEPEFFDRFDRNGDGVITTDEVTIFERGQRGKRDGRGPRPDVRSGKGSAHFLEKFDANGDGKVGKDEFPHERRFTEMDADGDGFLSKEEIEEALDKRLRESNVGFFERFDLNGDGKVTREEFTGPAAVFEKKDRNNDGVIDANDKPGRK